MSAPRAFMARPRLRVETAPHFHNPNRMVLRITRINPATDRKHSIDIYPDEVCELADALDAADEHINPDECT